MPALKIGITLASFKQSGKIPLHKLMLSIDTNCGAISGAAIFRIFIGISLAPRDLDYLIAKLRS